MSASKRRFTVSFKELESLQPSVIGSLRAMLSRHRLPHALLFEGPQASGQMEIARALAKILFCEKPGDEACDACADCRLADAGAHPDFFLLQPEADSRTIKMEEVRTMLTRVSLRPLRAKFKVFLVHRAECLNEVGQSALLKTLEEPEGNSVFILISHAPEAILATVRSRSQALNFRPRPVSDEESAEIEPAKKAIVEFVMNRGRYPAPDLGPLDRTQLLAVLETVIVFFRDAMVLAESADEMLSGPEDRGAKQKCAQSFSIEEILDTLETVGEFKEKLLSNVNLKLALSVFWDRLLAVASA